MPSKHTSHTILKQLSRNNKRKVTGYYTKKQAPPSQSLQHKSRMLGKHHGIVIGSSAGFNAGTPHIARDVQHTIPATSTANHPDKVGQVVGKIHPQHKFGISINKLIKRTEQVGRSGVQTKK